MLYDDYEIRKANDLFRQYLKIRGRVKTGDEKSLYIYNDDIHSMNDIIVNLMMVCGHSEEQAEQCAIIAHSTGKCEVKILPEPLLLVLQRRLEEDGIITSIEIN
jgi:ATP-dependent Clp protease adaptor protein ClpS